MASKKASKPPDLHFIVFQMEKGGEYNTLYLGDSTKDVFKKAVESGILEYTTTDFGGIRNMKMRPSYIALVGVVEEKRIK